MLHLFTIIATILWIIPLSCLEQSPEYELRYNQAIAQLQQDPQNPQTLLSLGFILKKLNRYDQAIAIYEHARPFIAQRSSLERALSGAYLALGDFERGWPAYEYRWTRPPAYNKELQDYLLNGGSLRNKIVLLKTEYGLGDTLQFIRYAQLLKNNGAKVIIECQKQLIPLLSLCPYIDELHPQGSVVGAHFFALLMSMPLIMNTTLETIPAQTPYLFADPKLITFWKQRKANNKKLHIGICWQADTHKQSDNQTVVLDAQAKSIALKEFYTIAQLEYVQLYSLQKVNGLEQLESLENIIHFDDLDTVHGPFMDTAALMKNLDLVITIDTSIAHLAGGLGVPCWLVLSSAADWRWFTHSDTSPWYPSMRLFRQKKFGEWKSVMEKIITAISSLEAPELNQSANQ